MGGFVQSGTELVTIVQTNPMKIDFKVPEKSVHDVGVGQTAEIRIDAFDDRVFTAMVEAVDSKVDPDSHSLALRASIENENNELFAGLFANVSLIIGERGNTAMVDESAIQREGTIEFVWIIEKGKARQKRVKTGVREKNMVEIVDGIGLGELVVMTHQTHLRNGVRVKVVNDKDEIEKERLAQEKSEAIIESGEKIKAGSAEKKTDKESNVTKSASVIVDKEKLKSKDKKISNTEKTKNNTTLPRKLEQKKQKTTSSN